MTKTYNIKNKKYLKYNAQIIEKDGIFWPIHLRRNPDMSSPQTRIPTRFDNKDFTSLDDAKTYLIDLFEKSATVQDIEL